MGENTEVPYRPCIEKYALNSQIGKPSSEDRSQQQGPLGLENR